MGYVWWRHRDRAPGFSFLSLATEPSTEGAQGSEAELVACATSVVLPPASGLCLGLDSRDLEAPFPI